MIALAVFVMHASEAAASSRLCRDLESRLANLPAASGNRQAVAYERAITEQESQLARARAQSRSAGCGFAIFPGRVAQCGDLAATMDRMEANLAKLRQTHRRMTAGSDNRRERARLLASIETNGCRQRPDTPRQAAVTNRSIISVPLAQPGAASPGGRYRTMCVRSCDGYYFPIENASSPQLFQRDQQRCQNLCPGADVELYYQTLDQEAGEMMSVASGAAYAQQPFAFRFRDTNYRRPESCGCNAPRNFSIIGGGPGETQPENPNIEVALPTPLPRPDPALDPESYADQLGGLDQAAIDRLLPKPQPPKPPKPENEADRRVRVVGPMFLPDPGEAIDLQAPARLNAP